ncbi:MAG: hypothetical protein KAU20_05450 [Nanoarchaeota archaeon]|nr:hypothetical protein [Nanoarchaeota archaeon]
MSFELGPCQVLYDNADVGATEGGVSIKMAEASADLKSDQSGSEPVDTIITGVSAVIECSLASIDLANFAFAHKASVVTDGNKQKVVIIPNVGMSLRDNAKKLIVKPYVNGIVTTDANKWFTFPLAGIKADEEVTYDVSTQRVIKVIFIAFASDTGEVAILGDETAS